MIREAYMPVYRCPDFHCVRAGVRVYGRAGPPEVVQEALADLKIVENHNPLLSTLTIVLAKMSGGHWNISLFLMRIN